MNVIEQARFDPLYEAMLQALKLQGKRPKTVEAYSRAVRRAADFFERCPDTVSAEELKTYFAALLETHSWSTIKLDRCGLQFFYRHVLGRPWDWVDIVKPPRVSRLPDVLTREQTLRLLGAVYKLRYRVFFLILYCTGLRLSEGLALEVGDIDGQRERIHVRGGKRVRGVRSFVVACYISRPDPCLRRWVIASGDRVDGQLIGHPFPEMGMPALDSFPANAYLRPFTTKSSK